ncbi:MAG: MFS transporter [Selenomonas montiformis]|nr:MFS transporter [Selenomonas montiformis]
MMGHAAVLLSLGHLLNDFYCNFLPILLPLIMPRLGLSLTLSGLLIMVLSITSNLLQPVFGYLMDKHNFSRLLLPVIPFGAICICSIGFIQTRFMLFLLIALTGLSVSAFHPLGSTLAAKSAGKTAQGSTMSYYIAGGNLGYAFAPILLVAFTQTFSLTQLPWLIVPSLLLSILYARSHLTDITTVPDHLPAAPLRLCELFTNRAVLKLNLAMGFRCWTHVSVSTFLPLLLIGAGYSALSSGSLLTLFLIGCTVGGLIGGYLGDRLSHKKIIVASLALGILPTWYFFTHAGTAPLSLAALFLAGACLLAPQPSSVVWAQKMMPANAGMASGMMMGLSFGLGSIGAALTAALADWIGLPAALLLTTCPLIISAILAALTPYPDKIA